MDPNNTLIPNTSEETSAKEPEVYMNIFLASGHFVCALFGIPLNLNIILFIAYRLRLRCQPCNIIVVWIGISNIMVLVTNIFELVGFNLPEISELCCIRFFLVGFPVVSVLMYKLFSLVERYLFIFHSVWYRQYVTIPLVSSIQLGAFILLFLVMKYHYIFGLIEVKCNVTPPLDRAIYFGFICFFVILCLAGQITLYTMIKIHLVMPSANEEQKTNGGNDTIANPADGAAKSAANAKEEVIIEPEAVAVMALDQTLDSCRVIKQDFQFVRIRDEMVSRLDLEATRNVIISVGLLLLFASTWIISSILALNCHGNVSHSAMDEEETAEAVVTQCGRYYWAISYTKMMQLVALSIYQSVSFMIRRKHLCATLDQS